MSSPALVPTAIPATKSASPSKPVKKPRNTISVSWKETDPQRKLAMRAVKQSGLSVSRYMVFATIAKAAADLSQASSKGTYKS